MSKPTLKQIDPSRWIGRPPIYLERDGSEVFLPTHHAFKASRKKRQIIVAHRRGRKTSMALEKMFQYLWANPKTVGKTLAPIRKQAKEIIWDDPDMLFHQNVCNPGIIRNINKSELKITLKNGSVWSLDGADDPHAKRGGNVKVLHLTEVGDHDEAVWSAVYEPVLMANGGIAIFEGNPRGKNWYFRLTMNAKTRPDWDVFEIPAARELDDGSLELITPIFTLGDLEDLQANTPDAVFRAEYLCEWIDSVGTVFRNYEKLATAKPSPAKPKRKYRMGLDLGKLQDPTCATVVDRHSWHEVALKRLKTVDWVAQKKEIIELAKAYAKKDEGNEIEIMIESNGVGEPIHDDLVAWTLSKEAKPYSVLIQPFTTTNASKAMLVSNLSMLFDQAHIRILPDPVALKELGVFTYKKSSIGFIYGAPAGEHDDTVMSKGLAYWDLGAKLPEPVDPNEKKPVKTYFGFTEKQWGQSSSGRSSDPRVGGLY